MLLSNIILSHCSNIAHLLSTYYLLFLHLLSSFLFFVLHYIIGVKHTKYIDGEPVDDEEDDNEDYIYTSPLDDMDVSSFFLSVMSAASVREPLVVETLQLGLDATDKARLKDIVKKVEARRDIAAAAAAIVV